MALSAVVLAAGLSSRMGSCKALLELDGVTFLERVVGAFALAGLDDVVVVTGHCGEQVGAAAAALGARPVVNPRYRDGMYGSVAAGAAAVGEGRRFFVHPVDCPLVRPETVGRLARTAGTTGAAAVVPEYDGAPGHPPLLGPELRRGILAARPGGGLRELLAAWPGRVVRLPVDDPGVVHDADTPDELAALRGAALREPLPDERRCLGLLREQGAGDALVAHATAVAAVAVALAAALNEREQHLCVPLVEAAALLHDVARAEPRHADAGADLLERLGYARVAPLVRRHMQLGESPDEPPDEAEVVYLADKLVRGASPVGLDERFAARLAQAAGDAQVRANVLARRAEAERVCARVAAVLGHAPEDVAAAALGSAGR